MNTTKIAGRNVLVDGQIVGRIVGATGAYRYEAYAGFSAPFGSGSWKHIARVRASALAAGARGELRMVGLSPETPKHKCQKYGGGVCINDLGHSGDCRRHDGSFIRDMPPPLPYVPGDEYAENFDDSMEVINRQIERTRPF